MPDVKRVLLVSLAINYGVLLIWSGVFLFAHDWMHRLFARWFRLSVEVFDALNWAGLAFYKVGIILFNLTPLLAIWLSS